jgi:hypothetical protein
MRPSVISMVLFAMFSVSAGAADWREIGSSDGVTVLVDVASIKTIVGSHTEVVSATLYKEAQKQPGMPEFRATVARMSLRCLTVTGSLSTLEFYATRDLKGPVVSKLVFPVEWRPVDPKTDVGRVWKYVCTGG